MNYSKHSIPTETKVAFGILALTAAIIVGGITLFKGNATGTRGTLTEETVMKNVDTNLAFSKEKVSPLANPKVRGTGTGTATTSTSTDIIEITEFLDYECPACASQGEYITRKLLEMYGERIIITRRIFPLHGEPSIDVARLVLASQEYGSSTYQAFHTKVLETQNTWARFGTKEREGFFKNITKELNMDYNKLVADGKTEKYAGQIDADKVAAIELGIRATPSFIINNTTRFTGAIPVEYFERYVDVR
jgi:protein-disulfide isomerase